MDASTTLDDVAQRLSKLETTVIHRFDHLENQLGQQTTVRPQVNPTATAPPPFQQVHNQQPSPQRPAMRPPNVPPRSNIPRPPVQRPFRPGPASRPPGNAQLPNYSQQQTFGPPAATGPNPQQQTFRPPTPGPTPQQTFRPPTPGPNPVTQKPGASFDFATTLEGIMKWAGLALVSFAAIFLVSTAITRGWIGPELQLAGAAAIGFSLYGVATHLASRRHSWASTLAHGATVITAVCAVASHEWLQLVSVEAGLGLVAIAAAISGFVAVRLRTPMVAMTSGLGLVIAGLVMQITVRVSPLAALVWLAAAAIASILIALLPATSSLPDSYSGDRADFSIRWSLQRIIVTWTTAAAMLVVGIQSTFYELVGTDATVSVGLIVGFVLMAAILWIGPVLNQWLPFAPQHSALRATVPLATTATQSSLVRFVTSLDHRLVIGLPLWLWLGLGATFESLTFGELGIVGGAIGAFFALAVALCRRFLSASLITAHLFGAGAMLSISAVVALDGSAFLVALTVQAVGVALVGRQLRDRLLQANAHVLILIAALAMFWQVLGGLLQPLTLGTAIGYFTVGLAAFGVASINKLLISDRVTEFYNLFAWVLTLMAVLAVGARFLDGYEFILIGSAASGASVYLGRRFRQRFGTPTSTFGAVLGSLTTLATIASILDAWTGTSGISIHVANVSTIALLAAGTYWSRNHHQTILRPSMLTLTWFLAMTWLVSVLIHVPQGQLLLSAAWAVAAGGAILAGVVYGDRVFQILGMITLTAVLLKLFTADLRTIDTFWRAGLFFVLGIGFLRLGYQLPKLGRGSRAAAGQPN